MANRTAVLTIQRDEFFSLPLWLRYYGEHFAPEDMYILDHESTHPSVVRMLAQFDGWKRTVHHPVVYASEEDIKVNTAGGFICDTVTAQVTRLLQQYDYVLYTDCDEIVIPTHGTLREFCENATEPAYRCTGREVVEGTQHWHPDFDKTLLTRISLEWVWGFHYSTPEFAVSPDLRMYHLHRLSFEAAWHKDVLWHSHAWRPDEFDERREALRRWFYAIHTSAHSDAHLDGPIEPLDEWISPVLAGVGLLPPEPVSALALPTWQVPTG